MRVENRAREGADQDRDPSPLLPNKMRTSQARDCGNGVNQLR